MSPRDAYSVILNVWDESLPFCPSPFALLPGLEDLGCMYQIAYSQTWNNSRQTCRGVGGDLAVPSGPDQYNRMRAHYRIKIPSGLWWVGIYNNVWLTGRAGVAAEWNAGQPTGGTELCGAMLTASIMADYLCSTGYWALCQVWP
nr:uncharacterized protein LOC113809278 [Penaeus vannamei]